MSMSERSHLSLLSFSHLLEARGGLAYGRRRHHRRGDIGRGDWRAASTERVYYWGASTHKAQYRLSRREPSKPMDNVVVLESSSEMVSDSRYTSSMR